MSRTGTRSIVGHETAVQEPGAADTCVQNELYGRLDVGGITSNVTDMDGVINADMDTAVRTTDFHDASLAHQLRSRQNDKSRTVWWSCDADHVGEMPPTD